MTGSGEGHRARVQPICHRRSLEAGARQCLEVYYGEKIDDRNFRRYEMTFTFRNGENNGYFYGLWDAYDNGRRNEL